jgi:hypothetical protein
MKQENAMTDAETHTYVDRAGAVITDLGQHTRQSIRSIEGALKESRKRLDRQKPASKALWFLFRAFQELEEAELIVEAYERDGELDE